MNYYQISISYKGTDYFGWQIQPNEKTIQGEIHKALKTITKSDSFRTVGSGRTDAGVHAREQVCKISMELKIEPESLIKALNSNLPEDIRVFKAKNCSATFKPTSDAIEKEYVYLFTNEKISNPHFQELISNCSYELDIKKMNKALALFVGEHNFHNFQNKGTEVKSTIRTIFSAKFEKVEALHFFPEHFKISIRGSGFLKQMVRLIVGALWEVGRGKIELDDIQNALTSENDNKIGVVAPPEGLYLSYVKYP